MLWNGVSDCFGEWFIDSFNQPFIHFDLLWRFCNIDSKRSFDLSVEHGPNYGKHYS
jgi:hypothetical protein